MAYNSVITRTDADSLIPEEVSAEILQNVPSQSTVLRNARRLPDMSRKTRRTPVYDALIKGYFVAGDTGLKQTDKVAWANKYIEAEEIAVIVPIPEAVLDDADYDIWTEIRPRIEEAFGVVIDAAVFHGTDIPASWTTNLGAAGLVAGATAASHVIDLSTQIAAGQDLYDIEMGEGGMLSLVENDGFAVSGHVADLSMKGKLRGLRSKIWNGTALVASGEPIFKKSMTDASGFDLDGDPIYFPENGALDATAALQISGAWNQLVWALRKDMTYKVLTEAVISDAAGVVILNLAQQDMVALRCVMRLGVALPNPKNRVNPTDATRYPFSILKP